MHFLVLAHTASEWERALYVEIVSRKIALIFACATFSISWSERTGDQLYVAWGRSHCHVENVRCSCTSCTRSLLSYYLYSHFSL